MTIEQYFKDKINWKIFNSIIDACTELEDNNTKFVLSIIVYFGKNYYMSIYVYINAYNNDYTGSYSMIPEVIAEKYIKYYKENGLLYTLKLNTNDTNCENILNKILKGKKVILYDSEVSVDDKLKYIFKPLMT